MTPEPTPDQAPEHDPDRTARDVRREQERVASRARQQAAYREAQRASRTRALRAAAPGPAPSGRPSGSGAPTPVVAALARSWLRTEEPRDRPPTELTAVELAQQRLEEAELQQALLDALAALPAAQRVAVVAALGYGEGPAGAAVELDVDPSAAAHLAQQGLAALRQALEPFRTHND